MISKLLAKKKNKSNEDTAISNKQYKAKYNQSQIVFVLLSKGSLQIFSYNETKVFELDSTKPQDFDDIFAKISSYSFVDNQRLIFLVDHPYVEVNFLTLPYTISTKTVRPVIIHSIGNNFVRDIDSLNFNFEHYPTKDGSHLVIYATWKEFSNRLASLTQQKKIWLEGIFALNQWFFKDFQLLEDKKLPEDYIYIDLDLNYAKATIVKDHRPVDYWRLRFNNSMPIAHQVVDRLKISTIDDSTKAMQVYADPHNEQSLDAAQIISPQHVLPLVPVDFNILHAIFNRLRAANKLFSLHRISDSWLKDALRNRESLRNLALIAGSSIVILLVAVGLRWNHYNGLNKELTAKTVELLSAYDPAYDDFDNAYVNLEDDVIEQKDIWQERSAFLYRDYDYSQYFKTVESILRDTSIKINKFSKNMEGVQISGSYTAEDDLKNFVEQYEEQFVNSKVSVSELPVNENLRQFVLNIR